MRVIRTFFVGVVIAGALWWLLVDGNPGGISDSKYAQFKSMAPPKLLYSCTRQPMRETFMQDERACRKSGRVGCSEKVDELIKAGTETNVYFVGGPGTSTYDELLLQAKRECSKSVDNMQPGEIKVLESDDG